MEQFKHSFRSTTGSLRADPAHARGNSNGPESERVPRAASPTAGQPREQGPASTRGGGGQKLVEKAVDQVAVASAALGVDAISKEHVGLNGRGGGGGSGGGGGGGGGEDRAGEGGKDGGGGGEGPTAISSIDRSSLLTSLSPSPSPPPSAQPTTPISLSPTPIWPRPALSPSPAGADTNTNAVTNANAAAASGKKPAFTGMFINKNNNDNNKHNDNASYACILLLICMFNNNDNNKHNDNGLTITMLS